jgi:alpha-tubulin suppressor-like RCC1 family protein
LGRKKEHAEGEEEDFMEEEKDYNDKLKKFIDHFKLIPELEGRKIICIAAHEHHSLAITREFEIYGWGATKFGKLSSNF